MSLEHVRAIVICVEYHDLLELTLPYNIDQFQSMTVVTSMTDERTIDVAQSCGASVFRTNAFYERGAYFNKYLAMEQGFDFMGRHGWICVLDADIVIPKARRSFQPVIGRHYCARRRMMPGIPDSIPEERFWYRYRNRFRNEAFAGYFAMFHADDPVLRGMSTWHGTHWKWAGSADTFFHQMWPERMKSRPPFEVLHLGPSAVNWTGRQTPFKDGTIHPKAAERRGQYVALRNARRGATYGDRYRAEKLDETDLVNPE